MLVFALLIATFMVTVSGVGLISSAVDQGIVLRSLNRTRALHLSEAGLDLAIRRLQANPDYTGEAYAPLSDPVGGYTILVTPDGPSDRLVQITGFSPSNDPNSRGYSTATIEAMVRLSKLAGPGYGVMGEESVRMDGFGDGETPKLDSYDSRQGPYNPQTARANVRLGTNANAERSMTLTGPVTIRGDVVLGPGSDPAQTLWMAPKEWVTIEGSVSVSSQRLPLESVELPMLSDEGFLHIAGHDVVTLPGGQYRFRTIHITGNGQLVFTGPAEVYVEEDVHISGNGIRTADQLPPNLTFYVTGEKVVVQGRTDLYAKIVAPHASVELSGDVGLFGQASGREVVVTGGSVIHYDEALNVYDEALNPSRDSDLLRATLLSWSEVDAE